MLRCSVALLIVIAGMAGCRGLNSSGTAKATLTRVAEDPAQWAKAQESDGKLLLEIMAPAQLYVGKRTSVAVFLTNLSRRKLLVPVMPDPSSSHPQPSRLLLYLYSGSPEEDLKRFSEARAELREDELLSLEPGQRVAIMCEVTPCVSGPASWTASLHNSDRNVTVRMLHRTPAGERGSFSYSMYQPEKAPRANLWTGRLDVRAPAKVDAPREPYDPIVIREMSDIAQDSQYGGGILPRAARRAQQPNELSAMTLCNLARSIGDKQDILRGHCFLLLLPMIFQGAGIRCLPDLIAEAKDPGNPEQLRLAMVQCLVCLWVNGTNDPMQSAEIGGHYFHWTLTADTLKGIRDTLVELAKSPVEAIAETAKEALAARSGKSGAHK